MDEREQLANYLRRTGTTIAAAESLTCGHVQANLGMVPGSSAYFRGGMTAYTLGQKVKLLEVDREHAATVGCVSQRVARQMAIGARKLFGSDIGISTTGYAEPGTMPAHEMAAGVCIRCGGVDMVGGRSDECNYKPFAWVGFNVLNFQWEERVVPETAPSWTDRQDARVSVQEEVAMQVIELLVDWFDQVRGNGDIHIPAVAELNRRGL